MYEKIYNLWFWFFGIHFSHPVWIEACRFSGDSQKCDFPLSFMRWDSKLDVMQNIYKNRTGEPSWLTTKTTGEASCLTTRLKASSIEASSVELKL